MPTAAQNIDGIYDILMMQIEPELTSASVPTLSRKYAGESVEQRKARAFRYEKAFAAYNQLLSKCMTMWSQRLSDMKRASMASLEERSRKAEQNTIDAFDFSLSGK